jgi:hypothetical protein
MIISKTCYSDLFVVHPCLVIVFVFLLFCKKLLFLDYVLGSIFNPSCSPSFIATSQMHPLETLTKDNDPYLGEFLKPLLQERMNVHWTFQTINYSPQP